MIDTLTPTTGRFIERFPSVCARTGKCRRQIYRDIAAGRFSAARAISPNSVGFYSDEIDAYLASLPCVTYAASNDKAG